MMPRPSCALELWALPRMPAEPRRKSVSFSLGAKICKYHFGIENGNSCIVGQHIVDDFAGRRGTKYGLGIQASTRRNGDAVHFPDLISAAKRRNRREISLLLRPLVT